MMVYHPICLGLAVIAALVALTPPAPTVKRRNETAIIIVGAGVLTAIAFWS